MAFHTELMDRLVAQAVGTYGLDLFIGSKSVVVGPTAAGVLVLTETGGSGSNKTHNDTARELPTAQILVRALTYAAARTKAKAAYTALGGANGLFNVTLSGTKYLRLVARQNITDMGPDPTGNGVQIGFNVEAEKQPS